MNVRPAVFGALGLLCVVGLTLVAWQRRELAELRQPSARPAPPRSTPASPEPETSTSSALSEAEKLELARLRGEVTRLRKQQRELGSVRAQHDRLRAQAGATAAQPPPAGIVLPAGYLRRSEAKMAGFATPDAALETFLWAIEQRDTNVLFQVVTLEGVKRLRESFAREGTEEFFQRLGVVPGVLVTNRVTHTDGSVELGVQFVPGEEGSAIRVRQMGGHWWVEM
ncbi:MAG: hypothetical protein FJ387_16220 [Verrucomicrobia bacterium]|nr:hypothetical protein [Verrucomicrobiota bacterium]